MQLEKVLEEIDAHAIEFEIFGTSDDYISVGWAKDIICKHMKNEEDILKFYYCESEDDYYIGKRVQNMYYARYADGGFTWFMSRYLPWGERVTAPETAWKEYTYPTEPKEIPFTEWLEGFIRKHMNDGWIPVEERLPEKYISVLVQGEKYDRSIDETLIYLDVMWLEDEEDVVFETINGIPNGRVIAWRPLPEPYHPESETEKPDWRQDMLRKFDRRE